MRRRNPSIGLTTLWIKLRMRGYSRSQSSLWRVMKRSNIKLNSKKKKKYKPGKYIQPTYLGQSIQIDTKHVTVKCVANGEKLYQFTAIDEYTKLRYIDYYDTKSTYSANQFLLRVLSYFPFNIIFVRTDNGFEYTNRQANTDNPKPPLFEQTLMNNRIKHDYIKPYTPRHNDKVERSHRKDNERFYEIKSFIDLKDLRMGRTKILKKL